MILPFFQLFQSVLSAPAFGSKSLACRRSNRLADTDFSAIDSDMEAAVRMGTNPGFISNRCAVLSKIRKGDKVSLITFIALWKLYRL